MLDFFHRVMAGAPISPTEVRVAGLIAAEWWLIDHLSIFHVFGL